MRASPLFLLFVLGGVACAPQDDAGSGRANGATARWGLGRVASAEEIAVLDRDVGPDGVGLPGGTGSVTEGVAVFAARCASCHGPAGQGIPPAYPALIGRPEPAEHFRFGTDPRLERTIGNYWPYATTVFDYVRRAMPQATPGALTDHEVYAVTAYLLAANQVIPMDATLDSASLRKVQMPYRDRFVRDTRRGGHEVR